MRAIVLMSLAVLALAGSGAAAMAESPTGAPEKPKAAAERVNTLSPDEARRAARARARAAGTAHPTPAAEPEKREAASKPAAGEHTAATPARDRSVQARPAPRKRAISRSYARHERERTSRSRRELAGERYPQVGDVVPPGVRLRGYPSDYDEDPSYDEPRRAYAPRGAYLPAPGAPPYPAIDDDYR